MGDSETVVAVSSTVVDYKSTGYHSGDLMDTNSNTVDGAAGDAATEVDYGTNSDAVTSHVDKSSAKEDSACPNGETGPPTPTGGEDGNLASAGGEGVQMQANQAHQFPVYDANANGIMVSDSNGNATDSHYLQVAEAVQQFEDGAVLSAEEERLWCIVKTNSLDFNAWTSLIEETEKTSQDPESKEATGRKATGLDC